MLRAAVATAALIAVGALSACGGDGPGATPTTPASPTATGTPHPDSVRCRQVLPDETVAELAGADSRHPVATLLGGLPSCRWDLEPGEWVQVIDVPAADWAAELPASLAQARASGQYDAATLRKLEEGLEPLADGKQLTPKQACAVFATFAREIVGADGSEAVVNFVPDKAMPQAVTAQRCVKGRYTQLQLVKSDLLGTNEEAARALNALATVG